MSIPEINMRSHEKHEISYKKHEISCKNMRSRVKIGIPSGDSRVSLFFWYILNYRLIFWYILNNRLVFLVYQNPRTRLIFLVYEFIIGNVLDRIVIKLAKLELIFFGIS